MTLFNRKQKHTPVPRIAFTAHYTGYCWYEMGVSHQAFATLKGRVLTQLLTPIERGASHYLGTNIRDVLALRHRLIDEQVDFALKRCPDIQIVECAAGLSPRGWRYRQNNPDLCYIELDLPEMVKLKQHALSQAGQPYAQVWAVDLLSDQLHQAFERLDKNRPVLVLCEGLVNYFSLEQLDQFWSTLASVGRSFPHFIYVTEFYPKPHQQSWQYILEPAAKVLKYLSNSHFNLYFDHPDQLKQQLLKCGFDQVQVDIPVLRLNTQSQDNSLSRSNALMWLAIAQLNT